MPRSRSFLLMVACALSMSCATSKNEMIPLDGNDPVFAAGHKTLDYPKARCFDAVLATFKNTGHGVERQDLELGKVVSGKTTVYSGMRASGMRTNRGTVSEVKVADKFYVSVEDEGGGCAVSVEKLRVWSGTAEVDTRTSSWIRAQLSGFMKGVERELADAQ
jgi:hypothetical protein